MKTRSIIIAALSFVTGGLLVGGYFMAEKLGGVAPSIYASKESTQALDAMMAQLKPHLLDFATGDVTERRAILDAHFYGPKIEEARRLYPVAEQALEIDGVYTEVFEPVGGVPQENQGRLLINLHGGAFSMGARTEGRLESIPVANVAGMRVVSVDYRQGPEHRFPAASEDVATVYRHFLKTHNPAQIGIFGCSAGGLLTAQAMAWFDAHDLPLPGAIGIFCAGAGEFGHGDSMPITEALGTAFGDGEVIDYFEGVDWSDPLLSPADHPELLGRFPPSLIITSTRDMAMSPALVAHQRLTAAGVESDLHVYEGLVHYFFADTGLPESRQVFDVTANFFDRHLAR
jgi:acetyl esterase/lipase